MLSEGLAERKAAKARKLERQLIAIARGMEKPARRFGS